MRTVVLLIAVSVIFGCAELQVASAVLDILVPDDPCNKTAEAAVEKAMVKGQVVYRISIPGDTPLYEHDEFRARSMAAAMETDMQEYCIRKKAKDQSAKQLEAREAIRDGKINPIWEKVK